MTDEAYKVGYGLVVSDDMLKDLTVARDQWEIAMGIRADPRTPEQIEADHAAWLAARQRARSEIEAMHAAVMADARGLRRAVLDLHGPTFGTSDSADARCEGCDSEGYRAERPGFPCRTYELAVMSGGL